MVKGEAKDVLHVWVITKRQPARQKTDQLRREESWLIVIQF